VPLTRRQFLGTALAACTPSAVSAGGDPASGLVSLEMSITEMLLTLGVTPLATANIALYRRLVAEPAMPPSVADLGPLGEPNPEYLYRLAPRRILVADWQAPGLGALAAIAPIETLPLFPGKTPALQHQETVLRQIAVLCQRSDRADAVIAETGIRLQRARARLSGFGRPVFLCRFNRDGRNLAIFGGNGMLGDVLTRIGLRNAYGGRVNALSGGANIALAQLAAAPDAVIVHFDRGAETEAALRRLDQSPLWHALPPVRAGRLVKIPVIYPTGGPLSAGRFADALAGTLPEIAHG
jgi:iron complex transport system substrate-binding protein